MAKKKRNKKRPPRNRQKRGGLPGGADMQNLMRQAQKLQEEMMEAQEDISDQEFEYTAGGEMVRVKVSGEKEMLEMFKDGLSYREIGKVLGRTENAIADKINKMIHEERRLDA